jgi:hypothetical protein
LIAFGAGRRVQNRRRYDGVANLAMVVNVVVPKVMVMMVAMMDRPGAR